MQLVVHNDGWAPLYNPRDAQLVLRNRKTQVVTRLGLGVDPRFWQPGVTTVSLGPRVPEKLRPGHYDVLFALPDPAPSLRDRPEYAIRFANTATWDPQCGCNSLQTTVKIRG